MWDVALPVFAILIGAGCASVFRWRERTLPLRQRRQIARMTTVRLADARPGEWVKIVATIERVDHERRSLLVRDESGIGALVHGGRAHSEDAASGNPPVLAAGERVVVVGQPRRADEDDRVVARGERVQLVFAGSDAHPLFILPERRQVAESRETV
jgi:hypothetical protein